MPVWPTFLHLPVTGSSVQPQPLSEPIDDYR